MLRCKLLLAKAQAIFMLQYGGCMMGSQTTTAIFVLGGSPAILAETLAAYAHDHVIPVPNKLRIITTSEGEKRLKHSYFESSGWQRFVEAYPVYQHLIWDEQSILVAGNLTDISSASDNNIMMNAIFQVVRDVAKDGERILASIAGGRKTMSYYLGLALSLFARETDVLTHVLVPPAWERDRDFLFPQPDEIEKVNLIHTPFVRLRRFLAPEMKSAEVEDVIAAAQSNLDKAAKPTLIVDYAARQVEFLGKRVELPAREFSFFRFFVQQKRRHCTQPERETCEACHACYLDWHGMSREDKLEDLYTFRDAYGKGASDSVVLQFKETWNSFEAFKDKFPELRTRLNRKLLEGLGLDSRVQSILLQKVSEKGYSKHGIGADKNQIEVRGVLGK